MGSPYFGRRTTSPGLKSQCQLALVRARRDDLNVPCPAPARFSNDMGLPVPVRSVNVSLPDSVTMAGRRPPMSGRCAFGSPDTDPAIRLSLTPTVRRSYSKSPVRQLSGGLFCELTGTKTLSPRCNGLPKALLQLKARPRPQGPQNLARAGRWMP